MILTVDPYERIIYLEGPVNAGDFMAAFFELVGPEPDNDFEWTIVPSNELSLIYQS